MTTYGVREAAALLHVSDDTVRRWAEAGKIEFVDEPNGRRAVDGEQLARLAVSLSDSGELPAIGAASARNRFSGIVTNVERDGVMARVEVQCGPYRVVSLISREAADELGLDPGVAAVASVKATNVVVERPANAK